MQPATVIIRTADTGNNTPVCFHPRKTPDRASAIRNRIRERSNEAETKPAQPTDPPAAVQIKQDARSALHRVRTKALGFTANRRWLFQAPANCLSTDPEVNPFHGKLRAQDRTLAVLTALRTMESHPKGPEPTATRLMRAVFGSDGGKQMKVLDHLLADIQQSVGEYYAEGPGRKVPVEALGWNNGQFIIYLIGESRKPYRYDWRALQQVVGTRYGRRRDFYQWLKRTADRVGKSVVIDGDRVMVV